MATDCIEVNLRELVDGALRDCVISHLRVEPSFIAATIGGMFFAGFKPKVAAQYERQLVNLVRERMAALRLEYGAVVLS